MFHVKHRAVCSKTEENGKYINFTTKLTKYKQN